MSEILEQIFGELRIKILRFFFRNENQYFNIAEISKRTQISHHLTAELDNFYKARVLLRKKIKEKNSYSLNRDFYFRKELRNLILKSDPGAFKKLSAWVKKLGSIKLAVIAGVLIDQTNSRVDLFIVGDYIIKRKFNIFLKKVEAEVGRELTYSVISTSDFKYRQSMFDNFVIEVLQKPNVKLIDRLGV